MITKLNHAEAKRLLDKDRSLKLIDVRTKEEFEESYIDGEELLPLDEIEKRAGEALPDKEQEIMVYCQSGKRSKAAAELLGEMGYKHIYDMGGLIDWPFEVVM